MQRREYKILPQVENGSGFPIHSDEAPKSCLISCLLLLTTLFILSGIAAILITFLWPSEFHAVVDNYWTSHPFYVHYHWLDKNSTNDSTAAIVTENPNLHYSTDANSSWSTNSAEDSNSSEINSNNSSSSSSGEEIINEANVGKKFAESMRKFEKEMERLSGIHQAELVIPLFMLVTLSCTLALISLCCCLMSKRREQRQRKLLGKFITDLQTGDSKILLGKEDDF